MNYIHNERLQTADVESLASLWPIVDQQTALHESRWIQFRRKLHRTPEASGQEKQTSATIADYLKSLEIDCHIPDRGIGVIGNLTLGNADLSSPMIALRADIDALRMSDDKNCSYKSQTEGLAHTCGHDVHTTVVLAAMELICELSQSEQKENLPACRFRFIFQPAEETAEGARWIVEDGALNDVDSILGLHVEPQQPVGRMGICYGTLTASVDEVNIQIKGTGGHTARPHNTTDPIAAAGLLISNLLQSLPRRIDVRNPAVFSFGTIHGGTASNVIPDHAELAGTLRTTDSQAREKMKAHIAAVCDSVASITGNSIEVVFAKPLGSVHNACLPTSAFELAGRQVLGNSGIVLLNQPSMGGEDFAVYLEDVPGAQIRLGCAGDGDWPLLHSPIFDVDEKCIGVGARILVRAALMLGQKLGANDDQQ